MKWQKTKISEFCKTGSGGTPLTRNREAYYGGKIPWVKSGELKDDVLLTTEETLTDAGLNESSAKWILAGSILLAMYGATVGKTAFLGIDASTNQAVCHITPDHRVADSKYVWYALRSKVNELLAKRVGGAQPNISQKIIKDTEIYLPALSEQRRIAEILDHADALRKKRAEADAKAVRILPALFYKMFGDPSTNPKGWPTVRIRDIVTAVERRDPALRPDNTFIYLDIAGVDGKTGTIVETKDLLGAEAPSRARQIVHENDVIISTVRPYLRATALVPKHLDSQICSTGFCVLRAREGRGFGLLYALSRLQWFTEQLNARARGASYPAVTDGDILNLEIPYPDALKVHEAFNAQILGILATQQRRNDSATALENLFATILHRAFTGDLTTKWREEHMKELLVEMEQQSKYLSVGA